MASSDHEDAKRRLVLLADDGVEGNDREQNAARSAAEQGWDVVVLGRGTGAPRTWHIGHAVVRLLPISDILAKRRHEFRRRWIIAPLAYPPTGIGWRRGQEIKAWRADLIVRRKLRASDSGWVARLARVGLRAQNVAASAVRAYVGVRNRSQVFGQNARRRLTAPSDRAYTWFWSTVMGDRAWRRLEPGLWDYELAYGPAVDELLPDVIHAYGSRMLGVAARAAIRARAAGRDVKVVWEVDEFLPGLALGGRPDAGTAIEPGKGLAPGRDNLRWLPGNLAHEREYAPYADATITVSSALAELLRRAYDLASLPDVVPDAPATSAAGETSTRADVVAVYRRLLGEPQRSTASGEVDHIAAR